jgi:signal peptidase I
MQCPNCEMENMPGITTCVRCQSAMHGGVIAVVPIRASSLRLTTRLLSAWYRLFGSWQLNLDWLGRWRPITHEPIPWRAVWLTLAAPGLGHLQIGHRLFGRLLLGGWCGAIVLTLAAIATSWSPWCFMMMVVLHALAFASLLAANLGFESWLVRALFGTMLYVSLNYLVYNPIAALSTHIVEPVYVPEIQPNPVISAGDGLLCQGNWVPSTALQRGDLVFYEIPAMSGNGWYIRAGFGIDRIVGLPGDLVEMNDGELRVNGAPVPDPLRPLGAIPTIKLYRHTVRDDQVLIIPSVLQLMRGHEVGLRPEFLDSLVLVEQERIRGRIVWRVRPWARFGSVK